MVTTKHRKYIPLIILLLTLILGCRLPERENEHDPLSDDYDPTLIPDIEVENIANGSTYDFGKTFLYMSNSFSFKIHNLGKYNLRLTGSPLIDISGTDSNLFSLTVAPAPSVSHHAGRNTTVFTIAFRPRSTGNKSAAISIANDDPDENPYTFTVTGEGENFHGTKSLDTGGLVGEDTSLVVDEEKIYVGYYDSTNSRVKLAKSENGGETFTYITIDTNSPSRGKTSIGANGTALYACYANGTDQLKFAKSIDAGESWLPGDMSVIGTSEPGSLFTSLKSNVNGIFIAYSSAMPGPNPPYVLNLTVSSNQGDNWTAFEVGTSNTDINYGQYPSVALVDDKVHVSYLCNDGGDLCYRSGTWAEPNITWDAPETSFPNGGRYTSIAADAANVYISHYDNSTGDLKVTRYVSSAWSTGPITSTDNIGKYSSLTLYSGILHLSYYNETKGSLEFTKSTDLGENFITSLVVDSADSVGKHTSIGAFDDTGDSFGTMVYISYFDEHNGDLKFAKSLDDGNNWD